MAYILLGLLTILVILLGIALVRTLLMNALRRSPRPKWTCAPIS